MDWLKLTQTLSRSYTDVLSNLGIGGDYEGWQIATSLQFEDLMISQGATPMTGCYAGLNFCGTPTNNAGVNDEVVELFGDIGELYTRGQQTATYHGYNYGYIADSAPYNNQYVALVSSTTDSIRTYALTGDPDVAGNPVRGTYLVRAASPVPLPASVYLLISGMVWLVACIRTRKDS